MVFRKINLIYEKRCTEQTRIQCRYSKNQNAIFTQEIIKGNGDEKSYMLSATSCTIAVHK